MTPDLPRVLIIDGTIERRKNIIEVFRKIAIPYRLNLDRKIIEDDQEVNGEWKASIPQPLKFSLILIHGGDHLFMKAMKDIESCLKIWYGGYEGQDVRIPLNEYKIYRKVKDDGISEEEAQELLSFAFELCADQDKTSPLPKCISPNRPSSPPDEIKDIFYELMDIDNVDFIKYNEAFSPIFEKYNHLKEWNSFLSNLTPLLSKEKKLDFSKKEQYLTILGTFTSSITDKY
ncbi:MAG: hypothetical protein MI974_14045 [Chitinophagales bacterium]|nr:hypothetical protein [Chitinophagales bacterium]